MSKSRDPIGWVILVTLGTLLVLLLFGCDTVFSPDSSRAVPGSLDYCADRAAIIVSPGSAERYERARREFLTHCTGSSEDRPEEDDPQVN